MSMVDQIPHYFFNFNRSIFLWKRKPLDHACLLYLIVHDQHLIKVVFGGRGFVWLWRKKICVEKNPNSS